jgi:hypothetical protein
MRWSRRWVKVFAEGPKLLKCSWQARGVYRLLKSHLDEDGCLDLSDLGLEAIAVIIRAPWEEIRPAVEELVRNSVLICPKPTEIRDSFFAEEQRELGPCPKPVSDNSGRRRKKKEEEDKKPSGGRPPGDARHRPMIDLFWNLWSQLRGGKYDVQPADAKAVQRFLKSHPDVSLEEIERRMRLAFADRWFAQSGNLSTFCSRWSNFDRVIGFPGSPAAPIPKPRKTVVHFDPETNELTYSDGTKEIAK